MNVYFIGHSYQTLFRGSLKVKKKKRDKMCNKNTILFNWYQLLLYTIFTQIHFNGDYIDSG